jgi:hypothetical protein
VKKQSARPIKPHLIRSGFYLGLLSALCVIPFALGQRNSNKQSVGTNPSVATNRNRAVAAAQIDIPSFTGAAGISEAQQAVSKAPKTLSDPVEGHRLPILPAAKIPQVVLYDQYNSEANTVTVSAKFSDLPSQNSDLADDFIVPSGQTWNVESIDAEGYYYGPGPANSFNVFFYTDSGGLPGTQIYSAANQPWMQVGNTFTVNLPSPAVLTEGTYWVEIQANMTLNPFGAWYWWDRAVQSNGGAAWQNPGGAYCACPTWLQKLICIPTAHGADQVFRLNGTLATHADAASVPKRSATPNSTHEPSATPIATHTLTPRPMASPDPCELRVLIVHTELSGPPTAIHDQVAREQGVTQVEVWDAHRSTPTLQVLQQYDIVFAFDAGGVWNDPLAMGNVLADYEDGGGVVVVGDAAWYNFGQWYLEGRWMFDGYSPFGLTIQNLYDYNTACIVDKSHPLMAGVDDLSAGNRNGVTLASEATAVAIWTDGPPAVAFKTNNGRTAVGINAPLGNYPGFSDDWGRVIVNAGRWLLNCGPLPTPTPAPTPTPGGACGLRILIAYSDYGLDFKPDALVRQISREEGVAQVDFFDALNSTPLLCVLKRYDMVFAFSDTSWNDPVAMGDVLADYEDSGGIVVVANAAWDQTGCWSLQGRWMSDGYTPYNSSYERNFSYNTADIIDPSNKLMAGVSGLRAFYRSGVTLTSGAVSVADWTDGPSGVAYKDAHGHTAVGLNAYLGGLNQFSGDWGRVIANAGKWLLGCGPLPTPAPSSTPPCPPIVLNGGISNSDPTQIDSFGDIAVASICEGNIPRCQIFGDGLPRHYKKYTFTNTTGSDQCVDVAVQTTCPDTNLIMATVYMGSFDPSRVCDNRIAHEGLVPGPESEFSFVAFAGQTYVFVVSEIDPGQGCPSYTMTITGLCEQGTATPTPSPTSTPASTPTSTPTSTPRVTPTPRSRPTPKPRVTPRPRP